jgi:hypothetical protein
MKKDLCSISSPLSFFAGAKEDLHCVPKSVLEETINLTRNSLMEERDLGRVIVLINQLTRKLKKFLTKIL